MWKARYCNELQLFALCRVSSSATWKAEHMRLRALTYGTIRQHDQSRLNKGDTRGCRRLKRSIFERIWCGGVCTAIPGH